MLALIPPLFLKYAYGNNSELGEFSLASCPRGNKLLQRDGCSWTVLEERMHVKKSKDGGGNILRQTKQK